MRGEGRVCVFGVEKNLFQATNVVGGISLENDGYEAFAEWQTDYHF